MDVYEHGISFVDQMSAMRGYAGSAGWVGLFTVGFGLYISIFVMGFSWVAVLELVLLVIVLVPSGRPVRCGIRTSR